MMCLTLSMLRGQAHSDHPLLPSCYHDGRNLVFTFPQKDTSYWLIRSGDLDTLNRQFQLSLKGKA